MIWRTAQRRILFGFILFATAAVLPGCNATTRDGTPVVLDGTLTGAVRELANPGSTYKRHEAEDDARCRQFGFKPGTEAYGNCRIQRDQIRATRRAAVTKSQSNELPFLCKDAISRGDSLGVNVHC
jgi:hypothetical protein